MNIDLTDLVADPASIPLFEVVTSAYCKVYPGDKAPFADQLMLDDEILPLLPDMSLVVRLADGSFPFKLAGTAVVERIGAEITGMDLMSTVDAEEREQFNKNCNAIIDTPCAHFSATRNDEKDGRVSRTESVALPVRTLESDKIANAFIFIHNVVMKKRGLDRQDDVILRMKREKSIFIDIGFGRPDWDGLTGQPLAAGS